MLNQQAKMMMSMMMGMMPQSFSLENFV